MKNLPVLGFALLAGIVGGAYFYVRLRAEFGPPPSAYTVPIIVEKHTVTEAMSEMSQALVDTPAPPFSAKGIDGTTFDLDSELARGPVVLTFIKFGCPCSEESQAFFNALAKSHPKARFLGVIDVDAEKARGWGEKFGVNYPMLLDEGLKMVHDYKVENSTYVVVIDGKKVIRQHWPGFSRGMLRNVENLLAELTDGTVNPIDVAEAPENLYSGCPFD